MKNHLTKRNLMDLQIYFQEKKSLIRQFVTLFMIPMVVKMF